MRYHLILTTMLVISGCSEGRKGDSVHSVNIGVGLGEYMLVDARSLGEIQTKAVGFGDNANIHFGDFVPELRFRLVEYDGAMPDSESQSFDERIYLTIGRNVILLKGGRERVVVRLRISGAHSGDSGWQSLNSLPLELPEGIKIMSILSCEKYQTTSR